MTDSQPTLDELLGREPAPPAPRPETQADRVLAKLGGARRVAELLGYSPSQVYRWTYPKDYPGGGMGGVIPRRPLAEIIKLARREGVLLTSADLDPRENVLI